MISDIILEIKNLKMKMKIEYSFIPILFKIKIYLLLSTII